MTALPLEHIRALVLTQAWAGTLATQLLGDMGADVIQVEALRRPDVWRGGYGPDDLTGIYPHDDPGERPYNRCARFNSVNRNKRGITLDLGTSEGKDLFLALVREADVVAENFSSRVMRNFGLDYAALCTVKPDIIMLSMPAYGHTGPNAAYGGIGGTAEPMSGLASLQGEADGTPLNSGIMYPDPVAGLMGCAAVLIALHHRHRTGQGQFIDLALQEATITFIGEQVLEYTMTGRMPPRLGNRDRWMAPHGTYRCQGDDAWVSLAVRSDDEWQRLAALIGQPWAAEPRLAQAAGRRQHAAELDRYLDTWTSTQNAYEMMKRLQEEGIPCAQVLTPWTVFENVQLQERGFFEEIHHPEAGTHWYAGIPWKLSRTPGRVRMAAPCLGEHNEEVLGGLLGLSAQDLADLMAGGITGRTPQGHNRKRDDRGNLTSG
jgi:crotonobetainyl-CoA:carnitine CoA-transferase CaiB-like acyl-CoA transferase